MEKTREGLTSTRLHQKNIMNVITENRIKVVRIGLLHQLTFALSFFKQLVYNLFLKV